MALLGPNMAGLPISQSGLRGSKMIPNDQYNMYLTIFNHLGLFWAHFDSFGSYQTKLDLLLKHFDRLAVCVFEAKN